MQGIATLKKLSEFAEGFLITLKLRELSSGVCKQTHHYLLLKVIYLPCDLRALSVVTNLTVLRMKTFPSVTADEKAEMLALQERDLSIYI